LIEGKRGIRLWTDTFRTEWDAAVPVQDPIAQAIVAELKLHLGGDAITSRMLGAAVPVQGRIAEGIAKAVQLQLAPNAAQSVSARRTTNLEAHELYLRGRHHWAKRGRDEMLKAIDYFNAAIATDSSYALAYSGLADAYVWPDCLTICLRGKRTRRGKQRPSGRSA
jgi:hypothetical protein